MKMYESDCYKARAIRGGSYLAKDANTLEEMRDIIDRSNQRAESLGYKLESWIIVHNKWYAWYDDNGMFVRSETLEQAMEIYPKEA